MPSPYPTEDVPFSSATCRSAFLVLRGPGEGAVTGGADVLTAVRDDLQFAAEAVRGAASTLVAVHEGVAADAAHRHLRELEAALAQGVDEAKRAVSAMMAQGEHIAAVRTAVAGDRATRARPGERRGGVGRLRRATRRGDPAARRGG